MIEEKLKQLKCQAASEEVGPAESPETEIVSTRFPRIPDDYRCFLLNHPYPVVFTEGVVIEGVNPSPLSSNSRDSVSILFGGRSSHRQGVLSETKSYSQDVPAGFLVIGETSGMSNAPLLMRVVGSESGAIYVWNRTAGTSGDDLYLMARSFTDLIAGLFMEEIDSRDGPQLISFETSTELDQAAKEFIERRRKRESTI